MAKPLKERGLVELRSVQRRVRRQHALGRIVPDDFRYLEKTLKALIGRIETMEEEGEPNDAPEDSAAG